MPDNELLELSDELFSMFDFTHNQTSIYADSVQKTLRANVDKFFTFLREENLSLETWIEENRFLQNKPFSFYNPDILMDLSKYDKPLKIAPRPYLIAYLNDFCRDKTIIKCRQSEFTENEININLARCLRRPFTNVLHIFPTLRMAEKIAKSKIMLAVAGSPKILDQAIKPLASTYYHFQNGSIYSIDGSWGSMTGRAGSFDRITFDEYEFHNKSIEGIVSQMLSHSSLKELSRISTPLFPGGGVDEKYNKSCQFEWIVTCPSCNTTQVLSFPENIINFFELDALSLESETYFEKINEVYIGCKNCKTYIDRTSKQYCETSKWVPLRPYLLQEVHGYRITAFMLPWKTGKEILKEYHKARFIHQFYNEVLGYAYKSAEASIDEAMFWRCEKRSLVNIQQGLQNAKKVSIGVDWGIVSWVVIRARGIPPEEKKCHIIYAEKIDKQSLIKHGYKGEQTDHAKRVEELAKFFHADIIVNDANGIGVDRNSYLITKFPGQAFGCFYDTAEIVRQKMKSKVIEPQWSKDKIVVSRVGSFKKLIEEYRSGNIYIPAINEEIKEFIQHHLNIGVERMFDEKTGSEYEIVGSSGADHYAHADNYSKIGYDKINYLSDKPLGLI